MIQKYLAFSFYAKQYRVIKKIYYFLFFFLFRHCREKHTISEGHRTWHFQVLQLKKKICNEFQLNKSRGQFFNPIYLIYLVLPRYNAFVCPRHLCPDKTAHLFFNLLYLGHTFVWLRQIILRYLSGPDKLNTFSWVICLVQTFFLGKNVLATGLKN